MDGRFLSDAFFFALGDQDTIAFMCVHLNHMAAKKEISEGSQSLKRFWDEIAGDITKHGVRIFTGDLNMQLFSAVAELRARGLQANLAAWYAWQNALGPCPRIDSCAAIMVGPCEGIRVIVDCSRWAQRPQSKHPRHGATWRLSRKTAGVGETSGHLTR